MVVVPTLLVSEEEARAQVEQLEVRFLANPDGYVYFALLTDWADAPEECREDDARLSGGARRSWSSTTGTAGARRWAPVSALPPPAGLECSEDCWMGWERKRGQARASSTGCSAARPTRRFSPDEKPPRSRVRYVITLDGDTRLPRGAVRQLVGAMAHPLNRPVFDEADVPGRRGARHPAAAHDADAAGGGPREPLRPALLGPARNRPLRVRRVGRLPGSLRGRPSTRGRASTTSTRSSARSPGGCRRTRCCRTTSSRASSRGPASSERRRALRAVSVALRGGGRPAAPVGARRLAAPALASAARARRGRAAAAQPASAHGALEDPRQHPPLPRRAVLGRGADRRLDAGRRHPGRLDGLRAGDDRGAAVSSRARGRDPASAADRQAQRAAGIPDRTSF